MWMTSTERDTDEFLRLLRYRSSASTASRSTTGLKDYVSRMKPSQTHILFQIGSNQDRTAPLVKRFVSRGFEVLYLRDEDAIWLMDFEGKKFKNIEDGNFKDLYRFEPLIEWLIVVLEGKISGAKLSESLCDSPFTLDDTSSAQLPILEINGSNSIIQGTISSKLQNFILNNK